MDSMLTLILFGLLISFIFNFIFYHRIESLKEKNKLLMNEIEANLKYINILRETTKYEKFLEAKEEESLKEAEEELDNWHKRI